MVGTAIQTVQTTGINWESVVTLVCSIVAALSIIIGAFIRYQSKAIATAVDNLGTKLEGKLESKEKVNDLAIRLSRLEERLGNSSRR